MADGSTKDTRVVEMQFDASDFDKNIKKSQKNLEDFKKELNFNDAVRQMNEGVSEQSGLIEKMAGNIQKLTNELTGVGSLSTYVAQKIQTAWKGALNSVEGFTKSLTSVQQGVGWDKYDKVTRTVQTIMNATGNSEETVYAVMEKLNHYTDETSYSFSEMASSIAKFTTAGVSLSDAETELEGIANWAALAGQGINEANRAMYNISQAMSAGSMKLIDWKSIQNAQMDTRAFREEAIKAAVAVGTLIEKNGKYYSALKKNKEVTVDNFTETLSLGWFDKATMEKVFKTFADNTQGIGEQAYKAAQRCMTFKDALDAIKDMLSTGWMKTYEHIFGKLSDAMALFSGMCNKAEEMLAKFMDTRNGILESWSLAGRDSLWGALVGEIESPDREILFKGAYGLLDALKDVGDMVYDAFFDFAMMFANGNNYDRYKNDPQGFYAFLGNGLTMLTQKVQAFTNGIKTFFTEIPAGQTMSRFDQIKQVIMAVFATVTLIATGIKGVIQFITEVLGQLQPAFDAIFGLFAKIAAMLTGNVVDMTKKNTIGNFFHTLAETLRPVTTILNIVVTSLTGVIGKVLEFLNATGMLQPAMVALVIGKIVGMLTRLQGKTGVLGLIGNIFGGKGGKIGLIVTAISTILGLLKRFTGIDVTGGVIGWLQNLVGNPQEMVGKLKAFAKNARDTIRNSKIYTSVSDWVKNTFSGKNLGDIWQSVKTWFSNLGQNAPALLAEFKGNLGTILGKIGTVIDQFFGEIIGLFVGSAKADEASEVINHVVTNVLTPGGDSSSSGSGSDKAGQSLVERLKASCERLFGPIKAFFGSFFGSISGFFQSDTMKKVGEFFGGTTFMGLLSGIAQIVKYGSIFRSASGIISMGKGIKSLGKGIKVFGKNLKDLNFSGLFSNMFNFSNAFSGNNSNNITKTGSTWANFGKNILMIAGAVGVLTIAALKLGEMKPEALKQAGIALAAMIGGLVIAGVAAKKWAGNGSALLKMAAAITLMLIPLKKLMALKWGTIGGKDGDGLLGGLLKLAAVVGAIALAARIAGNVKIKGLVGMAAAVNLLLHPIRVLSQMELFKYNEKGEYIGGLVQAIGALVVLMGTMTGAARLAGGNKVKGLLSMAIALNLLLHPIRVLAGMELTKMAQGIGAVEILILSLGGLASVTKDTKLASLAGVVTALAALSFIGTMIGGMELEKVLKGFVPIVALMGMMALVVHEAGKLQTEQIKALKTIFVAFAAVVAVMAGSMVALGLLNVPNKTIAIFFGGIILTLGMIGLAAKLAQKTDGKTLGKLSLVMGLVAALVAVTAGSLVALGKTNVDWKVIAAFMGGITAMVAAIGIFGPILSKLNIKGTLIAMGAIGGLIVAAGAALSLVIPMIMGSLGSSMLSMGARLKTISGLLSDFFARMDTISDGSVQHAISVFDGLKDMIIRFSGFASLSADINSVMHQLNNLGTGLDLFFLNDSSYPDPEASKSFKILEKFIEIGPALGSFTVGNMPSQLLNLGVGIMLFNQATQNVPDGDIPALGLLEGIFGQADNIDKFCKLPLTTFATQMSTLGGAMSLYAKGAQEVTGIEDGETPNIENAIQILNAVMAAVTNDGVLSEFTIPEMPEEGDLALFGSKLAALAMALDEFISAADGMNQNTQQAIQALGFLGTLNSELTQDKLKLFGVFGEAGLDYDALNQFALDVGALGVALQSFSELTEDTTFDGGLGALDHFQELNEKLTKDKLSFLSAFEDAGFHESVLNEFSTDIAALGRALKSFTQNVTMDDGTQADFNYAIRALGFMGTLQTKLSTELPKIGGLQTLWNGSAQTIGSLSDDVQEIGIALKDFSDAMSGIGEDSGVFDYDAVMQGLDTIAKLVEIASQMTIMNPSTGDIFGAGYYVSFLNEMMDGLTGTDQWWINGDTSESVATKLATFARQLSDAFAAVGDIDTGAIATFQQLASGLQNLMTIDPTMSFETPGGMIIDGLMTGMQTKEGELMESVVTLMSQISTTMAENTDLMPTITPVLDLSNIASGAEQIGSYFGEIGLDLWSAMERAAGAVGSNGPTDVTVTNPTDLSGIQSSIVTLQGQISGLNTAISNIRIVLNTGVVAGGVTDDIDANLGRKSLFAGRRN